jgi:hypothetical protein
MCKNKKKFLYYFINSSISRVYKKKVFEPQLLFFLHNMFVEIMTKVLFIIMK